MLEQYHTIPTISRLGEELSPKELSPERDDLSPKTRTLCLSEMREQNQVRVSAIFA